MKDEFDIFAEDGELEIPTIRGSANLDAEDYEGYDGFSSILDDDLQEDIPSTPGRHPGAAAATDIDGTDSFEMLEVEGGMDEPGMKQTTFGASPWGPGSRTGYRPYSQQRSDMDLRAMGDTDDMPAPKLVKKDSMHDEPEVIDAVSVEAAVPWDEEWHGTQNQEPSNDQIDPMTLYDRTSYEYTDSSQDTIGSGIFGMEEGATWRPRDGMFAHKFALPAYIGEEDELGVQQSMMWDSTAGEWRVTQPSASGVSLARKTRRMKPPFRGPRPPCSHIEAFGRHVARCLVIEARACSPGSRNRFLTQALDALDPKGAKQAKRAADRLVKMGYPAALAFEESAAHLVMHAAMKDLTDGRRRRRPSMLPRLDAMTKKLTGQKGSVQGAGATHLAPLAKDGKKLRADLGALYSSPAKNGMGVVKDPVDKPPRPGGAPKDPVDKPSPGERNALTGMSRQTKSLLIAGGVGLGAYLLFAQRKAIAKNVKKLMK